MSKEHAFGIDATFGTLHRKHSEEETAAFDELTAKHGIILPLIVWKEKNILIDGYNRVRKCDELGLPLPAIIELSFADEQEAITFSRRLQIGRRNVDPDEVAKAAIRDTDTVKRAKQAAQERMKSGKKADPNLKSNEAKGDWMQHLANIYGVSRDRIYNIRVIDEAEKDLEKARSKGRLIGTNAKLERAVAGYNKGNIAPYRAAKRIANIRRIVQEQKDRRRATANLPEIDGNELWQVWCMDCIEGLKKIADDSSDLVFTSPPYPLKNVAYPEPAFKYTSYEQYLAFLRQVWIECKRILRVGGSLIVNIDNVSVFAPDDLEEKAGVDPDWETEVRRNTYADLYHQIHREVGIPYLDDVIWWKQKYVSNRPLNGSPRAPRQQRNWEHLIIFRKGGRGTALPGAPDISKDDFDRWTGGDWKDAQADPMGIGSVWAIVPETEIKKKGLHPVPFPVPLARRVIALYSRSVHEGGGYVVDPFCGSGTTGVAAVGLDRKFIGLEIVPEFAAVARDRIAEAVKPPKKPAQKSLPELSPNAA